MKARNLLIFLLGLLLFPAIFPNTLSAQSSARKNDDTDKLWQLIKARITAREKLIQLYEWMGDMDGVITNKAITQEGRAWYLKMPGEAITEIEALLDQTLKLNLSNTANRVRIRLKYLYEEYEYDEKLAGIVSALEKIPFSHPLQPSEAPFAFHAASGRADLLAREKQFDQAASLYQKALEISRQRYHKQHDAWSEIYTLHRLARLETKRQHFTQAHAYADEALEKVKKLKMIDHHEVNHKVRAELAEAEGRYADALHHTKKFYEYRDRVDSLFPGFDLKKYFLELEAEELKLEKERQTLALQLKTSQLDYSIIVAVLALILAVGLLIGLYKQRKSKRVLAAQNTFILQQAEQLKTLDDAKSRFFANVSHELRTPLTLMLGPVKTLLKGNHSPQKQEQLLKIALQSGEQLQLLVNDILDLRKLEMGKMDLNPVPTDLRTFFYQYTSQFESMAVSSSIDFSFETSLDNGTWVLLDREKCRQVLHNLLSNAFKFTPPGGQVKVKMEIEHSENPGTGKNPAVTFNEFTNLPIYQFQLTVTDTGAGIHPDDLPHVFDRFYQTARPNATPQGGTSIGLALCTEYMHLFGGKMEVESRLGQGSTFQATFPLTLTEATMEPEAQPLESIPVFQSSAKPEAEVQDRLKALRIGVDDYLTKPLDEEELMVRIENLLKNQAARRAATADEPEAAAPLLSQPDREWLETFEAYVQKHFSSDILSVFELAHEFAMSESTLLRQLKRLTGLSPLQYLQEVRLNEARKLLKNRTYNSIAQVASRVGYNDTRFFSRSFRKRFGKLPSEMLSD
jgi:signal transduction histidine kinase/AraC-like DNA-binding protein